MPALYLATNTYFKKRLTLAVTFGVTGGSISLIFMPQICNLLLNQYGTKYTILILFAISLHAFPCCLLLRPLKLRKIETNTKDEKVIALLGVKILKLSLLFLLQTEASENLLDQKQSETASNDEVSFTKL